MKDELGGKMMIELAALRPKAYSYLMDDCGIDKEAKRTKKCERKDINLMIIKIAC